MIVKYYGMEGKVSQKLVFYEKAIRKFGGSLNDELLQKCYLFCFQHYAKMRYYDISMKFVEKLTNLDDIKTVNGYQDIVGRLTRYLLEEKKNNDNKSGELNETLIELFFYLLEDAYIERYDLYQYAATMIYGDNIYLELKYYEMEKKDDLKASYYLYMIDKYGKDTKHHTALQRCFVFLVKYYHDIKQYDKSYEYLPKIFKMYKINIPQNVIGELTKYFIDKQPSNMSKIKGLFELLDIDTIKIYKLYVFAAEILYVNNLIHTQYLVLI